MISRMEDSQPCIEAHGQHSDHSEEERYAREWKNGHTQPRVGEEDVEHIRGLGHGGEGGVGGQLLPEAGRLWVLT